MSVEYDEPDSTTSESESSPESGSERMTSENFYLDAEKYWSSVPATINGMLGGYECVSKPDVACSNEFLDDMKEEGICIGRGRVLDCGAGIGRVTKLLLLPLFDIVDMVEVTAAFLDQAESYIGPEVFSRVGERINCGLQDFRAREGIVYDVIWCQWVLVHLTDSAMEAFFVECCKCLAPGGVIVVKENLTERQEFDRTDSSVMRSREGYLKVFEAAKLKVVREAQQKDFPYGLYPVTMFALKPLSPS